MFSSKESANDLTVNIERIVRVAFTHMIHVFDSVKTVLIVLRTAASVWLCFECVLRKYVSNSLPTPVVVPAHC